MGDVERLQEYESQLKRLHEKITKLKAELDKNDEASRAMCSAVKAMNEAIGFRVGWDGQ